MKKALSGIVLSLAVVCGFASAAQAQQAKLFFEGDIVRGDQDGAPGPGCVLNSQFKHLEKVVWRLRILDASGKPLDDKGLKSLVVETGRRPEAAGAVRRPSAAAHRPGRGSFLDGAMDHSDRISERVVLL